MICCVAYGAPAGTATGGAINTMAPWRLTALGWTEIALARILEADRLGRLADIEARLPLTLRAFLFALVLIGGCALGPSATLSSPGSAEAAVSAMDLAGARDFREAFGLRSDEAWIVAVARRSDTGEGVRQFGVRLTPGEVAELNGRARNAAHVEPVLDSYGLKYPEDWAGLFVDQAHGGSVVVFFAHDLALHEAAIRALLHPAAQFEVRPATWTLAELESLQDRITDDQAWFSSIDAVWRGAGVLIPENRVQVSISSANVDAATEIERHFTAVGKIDVKSDGVGPWKGGRGDLVILASDRLGRPVAQVDCVLIPDVPSAYDSGDSGWTTNTAGQCRIPNVGATGYTIQLIGHSDGSSRIEGEARIAVTANQTTTVRVVVTDRPIRGQTRPIDPVNDRFRGMNSLQWERVLADDDLSGCSPAEFKVMP